jgi:hypothetical protein
VADIGYFGLYPLVFLGLLLMPQAPATGLRRMKMVVDVLIGISAVFAISSTLILGKLVSGGDSSTFDTAIGLAYPLADVAIILAVLLVISRSRRAQGSSSLAFLAVGFVAIAFADSLYTYLTEIGEYSSGSYIDAGWIAGYCIIAYGAYVGARQDSPSWQVHGEDDEPAPIWQPLAMYAPLVPLGALLLAQSDASDNGLLVAFLVIVALMFCRQLIAHVEDLTVNQRLAADGATRKAPDQAASLASPGLRAGPDPADCYVCPRATGPSGVQRDRRIFPVAPFVPRGVVVLDAVVAHQPQDEHAVRRTDTCLSVRVDQLVGRYPQHLQLSLDVVGRQQQA